MERIAWVVEGMASGLPALGAAAVIVLYGMASAWLMGVRGSLMTLASSLPATVALLIIAAQVVGVLGVSVSIITHAVLGLVVVNVLQPGVGCTEGMPDQGGANRRHNRPKARVSAPRGRVHRLRAVSGGPVI